MPKSIPFLRPTAARMIKFFEKVRIEKNGCWRWLGAVGSGGYGDFRCGRRMIRVHRLTYAVYRGDLPTDLVLDHVVCNDKLCCNPWHVELRTDRENILRGRAPTARNAAKTHCLRGHPLSGDNLRLQKN